MPYLLRFEKAANGDEAPPLSARHNALEATISSTIIPDEAIQT